MNLVNALFLVLAAVMAVFAVVRRGHTHGKPEFDQKGERYLAAALLSAAGVVIVPYLIPKTSGATVDYVQSALAIVALGFLMMVGRREYEVQRWRRQLPFGP